MDLTDAPEVFVRCVHDPDVSVRLYDRYFPDEYGVGFSARVQAPGLQAEVGPVEVWVWDAADLPGFLAGLAADYTGWEGERTWSTNHLAVRATFHSRGYVALTWVLQPRLSLTESWEARLTTWQEAGAQMATIADELREFLPSPSTRAQLTNP
ncbi:DUF6228 family protein [Longispora sp. K20-0274]|uniref:DUF6228 family protein n=1 Tax=Longispora sp. K20-0274 TaxID=3088255 RepID=UPI003999E9A4